MKKLWNRFKANKFLLSFSMLASGSLIAQVISIIVSPITTRLFTPQQLGAYTVVATAVSLFGPVICLKYDMAIVVAKTEKDTYSVMKLCLFLFIPLSVIIGIVYGVVFMGSDYSGFSLWMCICAITVLLAAYGLNNILLAHNNKNSLYKLISSVTVIKSGVNNTLLVISGLFNVGIPGLICSQIVSSFVGLGRQSKDIRKKMGEFKKIDFEAIKKSFLKHRKQPIYNASSALITTSIYSSINLFIKSVYSTEQLGLYSLSYRVLGIPFSVISANIARVFFDSAVKEIMECGNYKRTFRKTIIVLSIIIIPMIMLMAILAPWIFSLFFGAEWETAGKYVRLLAPMFCLRLIAESLTTSFIVSNKQHIELILQSILLVGEFAVYLISYFRNLPIEQFLLLISLLYMIMHSNMIIVMYKLSKESDNHVKN
ncbi:oligosaccharide flippase family protein [Clostridium sp. CM027]|uniref:lipopolysaccharide biosynthesis protein n=1 Tax=Clostridium sp. CM027 TaxID=2849865 RepID=UPI001C6E05E2|nr:oligosaccharide flippase family protein [Clostridium sp. CM027]MBW9145248.1 oligosaccharide flippase family protein [Clostridium sp. CM027]UVE40381.1 oligosaccharide flippase family protein [Clostridium sp. CM027]